MSGSRAETMAEWAGTINYEIVATDQPVASAQGRLRFPQGVGSCDRLPRLFLKRSP